MTPPNKFLAFFWQPPAAPRIQDPGRVARTYRRWRWRMLYSSLIGYGLYYFCRKNISVALPLLSRELGYSNSQLGVLGSLQYVSYAIFKGAFGFISDQMNPQRFMAVGLSLSCLMNLGFGLSNTLTAFSVFWFLNGVFQATGAPPCAKICARWFSVSERGTKWSIWNISHQAGGGIILILAGYFATWFGWQGAFFGPAAICLLGVVFIYERLRDRPEQLGLPPIEEFRDDPEAGGEQQAGDEQQSFFHLVVRRVLTNPYLLLLATSSLCVYVVRYGTLDWATKYLMEVKGMPVSQASSLASLIEFFGIPGMLLSGWLSDRLFNARRAPICVLSMAFLAVSIGLFYIVPPGRPWLDAVALSAIGFFTYGPQCLLAGVAAADTCGAQVAAAAVGITGTFSYVGAIISSAGTGAVLDRWGWAGGFSLWGICALLCVLLLLPMWSSRGRRR